jgi:hypothetical protein
MNRVLSCLLLLASPLLNGCGMAGAATADPPPVPQTITQFKACERGSNGFALPCQFDSPVTPGDLIVVVGWGGCNPLLPFPGNCNAVSDTQGNAWKTAMIVPFFNGVPLWYALDAVGGTDTINFATNAVWMAIIAEYPPSSGLDDANYGTYALNNPNGDPNGGSSDWGLTMPVIASQQGDLLIAWNFNGAAPSPDGPWKPTPGPNFTIRKYMYGSFMIEDSPAGVPGLYMASAQWNTYAHWVMGVAAFKMKTPLSQERCN